MNLGQQITHYRNEARDSAVPPFCEDSLLTVYANEGQTEAVRRGALLKQSTGPLCELSFQAGDQSITLDPDVLLVHKATYRGTELAILSEDEMTCRSPGWLDSPTMGAPAVLVQGVNEGELFLWPRPMEPGGIRLSISRLPKPMVDMGDEPEIRRELHFALVQWILYKAYSRVDSELQDANKAALALAAFESEFGKRHGGRNEEWMRTGKGFAPGPVA